MQRRQRRFPAGLFFVFALAAASGCNSNEPVMDLTVSPPDATVSVDGYVHPGGSPHTIQFKAPGRYEMTVEREGFKSVTMYVTVEQGERKQQSVELVKNGAGIAVDPLVKDPLDPNNMPTIPNVPPLQILPPGTDVFTLHITSSPPGAKVTLRDSGRPEKRIAGYTPISVDIDRNAPSTEVTVSLHGYMGRKRIVVPPENGTDVRLDFPLAKIGPALPHDLPPISQIPIDPPTQPLSDSTGFISVNTNPWTAVHLDGKAIGNTPLVNVKVTTGTHSLIMENRDLGKRRKKIITVRKDEHVRIMENLN